MIIPNTDMAKKSMRREENVGQMEVGFVENVGQMEVGADAAEQERGIRRERGADGGRRPVAAGCTFF